MMNGFILQENTSILISRNGKTLYSILHRSLDLTFLHIKLFSNFIFKVNKISYITGTTKSVSSVEEINPPITVAAIPLKLILNCHDQITTALVHLLLQLLYIGLIRVPPASINACFIGIPCFLLITRSINTIAFVTTIPINISIPIKLGTEIVSPVMMSASTTPITVNGNENKIVNGARPPLNVITKIK